MSFAPPARPGEQANTMIVRSHDGTQYYQIPLSRVRRVSEEDNTPIIDVALPPEELPGFVAAPPRSQPPIAAPAHPMHIPVASEELVAHKRPVVRGTVRVHKGVQTSEEHLRVPVTHEEAIVERIPAEAYNGAPPSNPDEVVIPVLEERLVVQKQTVVKEYLRIRKVAVTDQQEVRDTVRHEVVNVTEQHNPVPGDTAPLLRETPPAENAAASPAH